MTQDKQELHDALCLQEGNAEQAVSVLQALCYDEEHARQQVSLTNLMAKADMLVTQLIKYWLQAQAALATARLENASQAEKLAALTHENGMLHKEVMKLQRQQQQADLNAPVESVVDMNEQLCLMQRCDALKAERDQLLAELRNMRWSEPTEVW